MLKSGVAAIARSRVGVVIMLIPPLSRRANRQDIASDRNIDVFWIDARQIEAHYPVAVFEVGLGNRPCERRTHRAPIPFAEKSAKQIIHFFPEVVERRPSSEPRLKLTKHRLSPPSLNLLSLSGSDF